VFGSAFLANPDLPERFRTGAELNAPDKNTFYAPGAQGYIDYPAMNPAQSA
jgi:N-ethylmaleimide reductase